MEVISKHKISISHEFQTFLVGICFSFMAVFFPMNETHLSHRKEREKNECDFDGIQRKKANSNEY